MNMQEKWTFFDTGAKAYWINLDKKTVKKAGGETGMTWVNLWVKQIINVVENSSILNIFPFILHDIYTQVKNEVILSPQDEKSFFIPRTFVTLWEFMETKSLVNQTYTRI